MLLFSSGNYPLAIALLQILLVSIDSNFITKKKSNLKTIVLHQLKRNYFPYHVQAW
jgi:hypothetical protein